MFRKISNRNRYLILGVAVAMILVYFTPLWYIKLTAPQYRDGLSMSIWVFKITGGTEFDLQNINILNHYVGMKEIHADSFKEFKIMPYILAFMIFGAFVTFVFPRRIMVYLGLTSLLIAAVTGLYDFYYWEYDYGHNLSPDAALKIPGLNYQPPLIACKNLMNFKACSWPHVGSFILLAAGGILLYIIYDEFKRQKQAA